MYRLFFMPPPLKETPAKARITLPIGYHTLLPLACLPWTDPIIFLQSDLALHLSKMENNKLR